MNKIKLCSITIVAILGLITAGCLTSKKATVTGNPGQGFTTNYVTVVNEGALALETAGVSVVTSVAVNTVLTQTKNDPKVIADLKQAQVAIAGILGGANAQTTDQVLAILKANGNPALAQQISDVIQAVSTLEQQLLVKYGSTAGGEIALANLKAVNSGLLVGLSGH